MHSYQPKQAEFRTLILQRLDEVIEPFSDFDSMSFEMELDTLFCVLDSLSYTLKSYGMNAFSDGFARLKRRMMNDIHPTFEGFDDFLEELKALRNRLAESVETESLRKEDAPRLCFYGVPDSQINDLSRRTSGLSLQEVIFHSPTELSGLRRRDILVLSLPENEQHNLSFLANVMAQHFPLEQAIYLASSEDMALRLDLSRHGFQFFFVWPEDSFYFRRHFYQLYHNIAAQYQPYRVCLIGQGDECRDLETHLRGLGVHTAHYYEAAQALAAVRNGLPNAIVLNQDATDDAASMHTALRQFPNMKMVPVFHFQTVPEHLAKLDAFNHYQEDVVLPKGTSVYRLGAQILARLDHERDLRYFTEAADNALQKAIDYKTGLDFHNIISVADRKGRIIEVNDTFCRVSGYTRDELLGQDHRIVNSGRHPQEFFAEMWRTIASGHPWRGEVCNRAKSGELYWVESSIIPILDTKGRPEKYISIRTDVTHIKRTEQRLLDAQSMAKISYWQLNVNNQTLEWSDTIYDIFGYDRESFPPDIEGFESIVHPDDYDYVVAAKAKLVDPEGYAFVHRIIRADGTLRYIQQQGHPVFDEAGNVIFISGFAQDVTDVKLAESALKTSEDRLSRSQSFANIGTWDWNIQTGELYWSDRIAPLFGGERVEMESNFDNFVDALHPDDRQTVLDAITACVEKGEDYNVEHRVVWGDGTVRWLQERGDVVRTETGEAIKMLGIVQDVTERKQAEQNLIEAVKRAEKADQAKSDFLSSMSHELRTPLNAIIGFAELLKDDGLSERQLRQVHNIADSGEHLLALINQLLELSKIEEGEVDINIEPTCLENLVKSCLSTIEPLAKKHRVDVLPIAWSDFDRKIDVDGLRFKQVLLNLLSNAVKYNRPNGTLELKAQTIALPGGQKHVRIAVTDTGYGIPLEKQSQVFAAYKRLGQETSDIEGTGIGLSITQKLVELMDGEIGFSSEEGKGSSFWVALPLTQSGVTAVDEASEVLTEFECSDCLVKVLLVDDNPNNMRLMAEASHDLNGVELNIAPTLELGLDMLTSYQPNLVLLGKRLAPQEAAETIHAYKNIMAESARMIYCLMADFVLDDVDCILPSELSDSDVAAIIAKAKGMADV
jgi:PAS domain S-box